jgi:hypothetical protein
VAPGDPVMPLAPERFPARRRLSPAAAASRASAGFVAGAPTIVSKAETLSSSERRSFWPKG